ncbi:bifunctional N-glycosylase/AP lyase NTG2 [Sugiyamaella lignohabitans]|uniref:Endonuclease III homolog n=1 Tax=Sugiyamaella lignohabitans TaxID=796027 RepID=A0A167E6Y5_9ASCO|nr:bifunctional N-glycosylase/AP lyase NTG2 [Sugiyamaella lignohabitans]ANB13719.1 bifunctional N-glycosylase/AP lyase NTG2 [Sugiyamaella lignohabitans]
MPPRLRSRGLPASTVERASKRVKKEVAVKKETELTDGQLIKSENDGSTEVSTKSTVVVKTASEIEDGTLVTSVKSESSEILDKKSFVPPTLNYDPFKIIDISKIKSVSDKEPKNWRDIYSHVQKMRANTMAPVDTMGCERLPEAISSTITPAVHRYQLLIALMLSAQTKDEVNAQAMATLRRELSPVGGLTIDGILATQESEIDRMIFKVGFHSRKAKYIKLSTQILRDQYDNDIPKTIEDMVSLPGVGPKMAHLLMHRAWGVAEGIGVDVHVHRLANMWGWTGKNSKLLPTPERTREALESWLPKELWVDINPLLVGFGQTICIPRGRKCDLCTLAPTGLCKNVDRSKFKKVKRPIPDIEDLI